MLPLLCRPEAAPLRERAGVEVESLYTGDTSPWQVFIHDANDYGEAPKKEILQAENASGHTEFDPAVLNYRYPYQRETQLPAKLTATQLKGRALDEEIAEDALHTPSGAAEIPAAGSGPHPGGAGNRHASGAAIS